MEFCEPEVVMQQVRHWLVSNMMLIYIDSKENIQILSDELTNTLGKAREEAIEGALFYKPKVQEYLNFLIGKIF